MGNPFHGRQITLGSARDIVPIVPDDNTDLDNVAVGLYVETGGTIVINTVSGQTRTIVVADFATLPVGVSRVHVTGTTAQGIHGYVVT